MAVTVKFGVNSTTLDSLAGKSINEIRDLLTDTFDMPSGVVAKRSGMQLSDDDVAEHGDTIEFLKASGNKAILTV